MEATTTLADALLDDLDDLMDSDEEDKDEQQQGREEEGDETAAGAISGADDVKVKAEDDNVDESGGAEPGVALSSVDAVSSGVKRTSSRRSFLDNATLQEHLNTIRNRHGGNDDDMMKKPSAVLSNSSLSQKEIQEEDHQLVVQSNKHLSQLQEELGKAHGDLALAYKPKFPELEELVPNYIQYKNTARLIGNEMDLTKVDHDKLQEILTSNQIMTISVAAATTSGRPLNDEELTKVDEAATYMEQLLEVQSELIKYVENSMESLCPSICALIGPSVAARLLGLAGGLAELTKIPSCNLQVMGQVKQTSTSRAGLSTSATKVHAGILTETDLVSQVPKHLQKKALKTVAAKLALTARFDYINVDTGRTRSASTGLKFRQEIQTKFEKWLEPDKAPVLKALPKPDLTVKKRRGGKRMRRWKERFEETAMMKQANTRAFSSQQGEYGDDAMGVTLGLLDSADSGGNIRKSGSTGEKRKMRQANTKASRKRQMQMTQKAAATDGLASSVVFNQTSSMELVNPDANKDRVREANRKWFNENAGFQSALPPKK